MSLMKQAAGIFTDQRTRIPDEFRPFEMELKCPSCAKEIGLVVSKVHIHTDISCPRCSRPLSAIVRRKIRAVLKEKI